MRSTLTVGCWRFIPACVGNSLGGAVSTSTVAVHPRVCGELIRSRCQLAGPFGSSPRVWGTRIFYVYGDNVARFIPACVGNSLGAKISPMSVTVHPRVCGELTTNNLPLAVGDGSSPRVWGTLHVSSIANSMSRFIPACVGNSTGRVLSALVRTVHPRVCGELSSNPSAGARSSGSSPRVWGTLSRPSLTMGLGRFIPACVGNSGAVQTGSSMVSVHPRVCGELRLTGNQNLWIGGSSPRVWGTLFPPGEPGHDCRFIPACVGNSLPKWTI